MKLAFINFYSGFANRGGESFVDSLASQLSEGNDIYLFQAGKVSVKPYTIISKSTKFVLGHNHSQLPLDHWLKRLFLDYYSLNVLRFTLKIIPDLINLKPDIVYPLNSGWQILIIKIFSILTGSKLIVAGHSGPGWDDRVNLLFRPDAFVALTNAQSIWAKRATFWKKQKIVHIPNGVDVDLFNPNGDKLNTKLKKPIVLIVGASTTSKRIIDTIHAVRELERASLLVCGSGPHEKEEDNLGESLLNGRYQRVKVKHSEMPGVYRAADVFTLCSDSSEAFGIAYLEALASGLPCVATDDVSRREILGPAGLYVRDPTNSKEYAKKLRAALIKGINRSSIMQAKKFSWKMISDKYRSVIKELLI